jgi:eukaryotic-like serine/threonine-protein kinase
MAGSEHLPGDDASSPTLGSYRLTRRVARGGMGEIWRGVDLRSGADVAVKRLFLDPGHPAFERNRERLIQEAAALRRLQHGNVVRYLDAGSDAAGQPFLVLEWLEGESLAQRRRRAPLELELVLHVARQALRGLTACHGRGIVHRDIKPGNLMLVGADELQVKVVDFGLALLNDETTRLTHAGQMLGTLHYLSPEQARGLMVIDGRADLYALGVVLYELVTGRLPFESDQAVALLLKIVTEMPPDPGQLRPGLPGWLDRLILRAMSREPVDRYGSAEEMLAALEVPEARRGAASLDLPEVIAPATGGEVDTLQAPRSVTEEVRLVQLLCLQPGEAGEAGVDDQLHQALEQHGAVVYRLLGGQIIGVFGLHQTRGDETRRALEAGLAARTLAGARARLLAASVHLEVGQGLRLNAPELDRVAEKLIGLPPGELVLDDQLGSLQPWSLVAEVRRVKGHSAVKALITDAPIRPVLGEQTPTVGRQTELVALRAALDLAEEEREPEAVVVVGPPGIGKSRLLHELRVDLRRRTALLLEGRTSSTGAETPYALVAGAVRRQCRIRVGHDDPRRLAALEAWVGQLVPGERGQQAARFIGSILGLPVEPHASLELARDDPRLMREQVTRAFETVLGQAAAAGPVCLVLEDLQWADEESLALVERLLERMERTPLLVLATGRPQLLERHPRLFEAVEPTRIDLRPLGRRSLRRLLRAVLGQDLPEEAEERVLAWCGGNPYFAEELITWMVGCEALVREGGRWTLRQTPEALQLPVGVEAAIQARLDDLDPELKELLKAAAICGEAFWEGACEAAGHTEVARKLEALQAAELVTRRTGSGVTGTREWLFRHGLLHQVALGMLPPQPRRLLHLQLAAWLEGVGEQDAALLAHHYKAGGDAARAARYAALAGERALSDGDAHTAVTCFMSALSMDGAAPSRTAHAGQLLGLARSLLQVNRYDEAIQQLQQLEALATGAGAAVDPAELRYLQGRTLLGKGDYARAEATLQGALDLDVHEALGFKIRQALFWVIWVQGRYRDAGPLAEALFTEAEADDQLCAAKLCLSYWEKVEGDLSRAVVLAAEAVAHARAVSHPFREMDALMLLGVVREAAGQYDAALEALAQAQSLAVRLRTAHQQAGVLGLQARIQLTLGALEPALELGAAAIGTAETLGDKRLLVDALVTEARSLSRPGAQQDLDGARQRAERALALARDNAPTTEAEAELALAEVFLARGDNVRAAASARAAVALLDQLGTQERYEIEILLAGHDALLAASEDDAAAELLQRAAAALQRRSTRIGAEGVRASFLGEVPYNRRVEALRALGSGRSGSGSSRR